MQDVKWNIRRAKGEDLPFIYATWLNSFWFDSQSRQGFRKTTFFQEYPKVIDHILNEDDVSALVACSPEDEDVIFGYLIASPSTLHYAFTKEIFRRYGIASALYREAGCPMTASHRTYCAQRILDSHPDISVNPFKLFKQGDFDYGQTFQIRS